MAKKSREVNFFEKGRQKNTPTRCRGFFKLNRPYKKIFWFTQFISSARIV